MAGKFRWRSFISMLLAFSFISLTITGIILFIVPQGRIAYWVDWKLLGLTKTEWTNIHQVSWLVCVIVACFHIYYNWNAIMAYLFDKTKKVLNLKTESLSALLIVVFIIAGSLFSIPPVKYFIDLNDYIKNAWIKSKEYEPPFGHAEELSLKVFAKKMNIDLDSAIAELKKEGIKFESEMDSLKNIAKKNNTSPMNIYLIIKKFEAKPQPEEVTSYTPEMVEERYAGKGIGRMTLLDVCNETKTDIITAQKRLSSKGIIAKDNETLREIAQKSNLTPIEVMKIVLIEGY